SQVAANLFVPTLMLVTSHWNILFGFLAPSIAVGGLCELAADTVSSEIGSAYGRPTYMIGSRHQVEPGVNGGVSLLGSTIGIGSSAAVAILAAVVYPSPYPYHVRFTEFGLASLAGIFGMYVDSMLGASLETRGKLDNDAVNLLSSVVTSVTVFLLLS